MVYWLADWLEVRDSRECGVGLEDYWRWVWWVDGNESVDNMLQFWVKDKLLEICVI